MGSLSLHDLLPTSSGKNLPKTLLSKDLESFLFSYALIEVRSKQEETKLEVVVTFLAVLELARQKIIILLQGDKFGEIYLSLSENKSNS